MSSKQGKKKDTGFANHFMQWVEVVRDGWRGYPGSLEVTLHSSMAVVRKGCGPAAPSVSGTEL